MAMFGKLNFSTFRFRSPERDAETDQARFSSIERAIDQAILQAQAERDALERRLDYARTRASFLVGTDLNEHESRTDKDTELLARAEREMEAAARRLRQLRHQSEALQELRTHHRRLASAQSAGMTQLNPAKVG